MDTLPSEILDYIHLLKHQMLLRMVHDSLMQRTLNELAKTTSRYLECKEGVIFVSCVLIGQCVSDCGYVDLQMKSTMVPALHDGKRLIL